MLFEYIILKYGENCVQLINKKFRQGSGKVEKLKRKVTNEQMYTEV